MITTARSRVIGGWVTGSEKPSLISMTRIPWKAIVLDGFSRYIVHHELRESMTEVDVEIVIQVALEKHPGVKPRIISDNGSQYLSKDFKAFIRFNGMTHVTTSPYYPQSNGKQERFYGTEIHAERDRKLEEARAERWQKKDSSLALAS